MAKDFLAFLGFIFLTIMILTGVMGLGYFYDWIGLVTLPGGLAQLTGFTSSEPAIYVDGKEIASSLGSQATWRNPLEQLPASSLQPTPIPTPQPTIQPTPVPMEPLAYRTQALSNLKQLVTELEGWMAANDQLAGDPNLMYDPNWRSEVESRLQSASSASLGLAQAPPPGEYAAVGALFDLIRQEMAGIQSGYQQTLATGDLSGFTAAADHLTILKDYLNQAAAEMIRLGWTVE